MSKKVLLFLVLLFGIFSINVNGVYAEDPTTGEGETTPEPTPETAAWGPSYDQTQIDNYRNAVEMDNCATPSLECLVHQTSRFVAIEWVNGIIYPGSTGIADAGSKDSKVATQQGGFVSGIAYLIGEMYRYPAARTSIYVADVLQNAHIITPAYAQGLGFASLNPVLDLWKIFRNVSYMLFIMIFIVLGFMIMFRQKIGGQSAVTAQQAIPSVIASLIFVTFSYAIAGFLIDMMYLLMFMIIGIFEQTTPDISGKIMDFDILELMGQLNSKVGVTTGGFQSVDIVKNLMGSMVESEKLGETLGVVGGVTLSLVLAVAILIGTFKLFFELLKSYAIVVLYVVTAPLILLGGAFPGKNVFGPWIKNIIANLSAFPTVLMTVILFYQFTKEAPTTGGFIPPFLLGRGQADAITTLMGLAIILALPEIVKDVKKNLGATEGFGTMVFNAASARAKSAWSGDQTKGWGAKRLLGGATFAGATIAGAGGGALVGGSLSKLRGGSFRQGAGKGALYGGLIPAGLRTAPGLVREGYGLAKKEVADVASTEIIGSQIRKVSQGQSRFKQYAEKLYAKHYADRSRTPRRSTNSPSETSVSDDLGSGNA